MKGLREAAWLGQTGANTPGIDESLQHSIYGAHVKTLGKVMGHPVEIWENDTSDSAFRRWVSRAGLFGKVYFGHKETAKESAAMERAWKCIIAGTSTREAWKKKHGLSGGVGDPSAMSGTPVYEDGECRLHTSMTYGVVPSFDKFNEAFDICVPRGRYAITLSREDSDAAEGTIIGDDEYRAKELYDGVKQLVAKYEDGNDAAGDLASSILHTLGFEWV